jgi:hypothetical protein
VGEGECLLSLLGITVLVYGDDTFSANDFFFIFRYISADVKTIPRYSPDLRTSGFN